MRRMRWRLRPFGVIAGSQGLSLRQRSRRRTVPVLAYRRVRERRRWFLRAGHRAGRCRCQHRCRRPGRRACVSIGAPVLPACAEPALSALPSCVAVCACVAVVRASIVAVFVAVFVACCVAGTVAGAGAWLLFLVCLPVLACPRKGLASYLLPVRRPACSILEGSAPLILPAGTPATQARLAGRRR